MHFKTLVLLLATVAMSSSWAGDDPYLWLEDINGEKALAWVEAQNKSTAERLESKPIFAQLLAQARAALNSTSRLPEVYQEEGWLYNFWKDENHPRGIFRRATLDEFAGDEPAWETVLDIDALNTAEDKQWVFKGMDCLPKRPEHCLVHLSPGGGDANVIREFNSVDKTFVEDGFYLPRSKGNATWIDADTVYVSTNFGEGSMTDSGYPRIVKRWKRGTPSNEAELIHAGKTSSVWSYADRLRSAGADIDMVREGLTFWTTQRYQLIDGKKQKLELPLSADINGAFRGRLIVSLKEDWKRGEVTYPQGAVLVADTAALRGDSNGVIDVLVTPDASSVVEAVTATDDTILVTMLENVRGKIYRYNPNPEGGWERSLITFPDNGTLEITSTDNETGNFFARFESFTSPPALYYVAAKDWQPRQVKTQAPTFDGGRYQTEQYFATS
ncbi:MAG: S9 family peptidase, partial [Xanthomonadales bacterium]|nr:S9 family peptidase [Xanthomonadales bacterium]